MNFGLGLVLSFTDNASVGINNAVNSLHELSESAGNAVSSLDQMASLRSLSVVANEIGNAFVEAGGTTFSFIGRGGTEKIIDGTGEALNLKAADYIEIGSDGIIIDSGTNAEISITSSVSGTVNVETAVTFAGNVNNTETSGYWIVNGDKNTMKSGSTFTYTPTSSDAGKTVTITYMILDSSYNTISTNYYLTVNAST